MRLYFPVDLTGNLIMFEKLVLGEIWTGDLPIFNPDALTSAPSWQAKEDLLAGLAGELLHYCLANFILNKSRRYELSLEP